MLPVLGVKTSQITIKSPPLPCVTLKATIPGTAMIHQAVFGTTITQYGNSGTQMISKPQQPLGKLSYAAILRRPPQKTRNFSISTNSNSPTVDTTTIVDSNNTKLSKDSSCTTSSYSKNGRNENTNQRTPFWTYTRVNDEESLQEFLTEINTAEEHIADIFADAEGGNGHGRNFNLNTVQIKMVSLRRSWLIDIKTLGDEAFDTPCTTCHQHTFRQILENKTSQSYGSMCEPIPIPFTVTTTFT
jgi:hypothetical protein